MSFQDKNSVHGLLALLREAQDDEAAERGATSASRAERAGASTSRTEHSTTAKPNAVPSASKLSELLAQLDGHPGVPAAPASSAAQPVAEKRSAFDGPDHSLIDWFGPVNAPRPTERRTSSMASIPAPTADEGKRKADGSDDPADWAFTRCLPVLTDLLRDTELVREVKKMKAEQDSLERRLWARTERVKADHAKKTEAERQVARITRKPVPPEKTTQWERDLRKDLSATFKQHVQPAMDALAGRQRLRLAELGVPGLGGDKRDVRTKERVRRIMDVLEGAIDD